MSKIILRAIRRFLLLVSKWSLRLNPRYHFIKIFKGSTIVKVNGFKMCLNLRNDVGISRDLFLFKKREHLSIDYVLENSVFEVGTSIVDLGANIGYYVLPEARAVGSSGSVYAIEPVSKNYKNLQKNISLNGMHNIKTFRMAIGDKKGTAEINIGEKGNFSSMFKVPNAKYEGLEEVEMNTLDGFVEEQSIVPSLVRMDVEGYESKIIKGMVNVLTKYKPKLLIEIHPHILSDEEVDEMFSLLIEKGYSDVVVISERKDVWMNRKGGVRPVLKFISKFIEGKNYTKGTGLVEKMDIIEVQEKARKQSTAFHALIT